ncbi:MAG: DUF4347 domain-containing protein, partial [Pseudohongiellaceae bacterium]
MSSKILQGLAGLLIPIGLYGASLEHNYDSDASVFFRGASSHLSTSYDLRAADVARIIPHKGTQHPAALLSKPEEWLLADAPLELLIIDAAVPDKHLLLNGLSSNVQVEVIDQGADGLHQLETLLSNYSNLSALHLVSHGSDGALQLGETVVNSDLLQKRQSALAALDSALLDGADVLFYGCDLAASQAGHDFLQVISATANVNVAASNDLTGSAELGGDWDLEAVVGNVQSSPPFAASTLEKFSAVLQTTVETLFLDMATGGFESVAGTAFGAFGNSPIVVSELFDDGGGGSNITWSAAGNSADMVIKADGTNACKFTVTEINAYSLQTGGISVQSGASVKFTLDGGATVTRTFSGNLSLPEDQNTPVNILDPLKGADSSFRLENVTTIEMSLSVPGTQAVADVAFKSIVIDDIAVPANCGGGGGGGGGGNTAPAISVDNSSLAYMANNPATQIDMSATLTDADGD